MADAITPSLSRQSGLLKELVVLAGNVANAGTEGYRREASVFTEYVDADAAPGGVSIGALRGHYADRAPGAMVKTGAAFDLAIEGEGMFAVQRGEEVLLTRAGRFQLDAEGTLVTASGHPVLDEGGGMIEVPPETADVTVSPDGTISLDGLASARIGIMDARPGTMERAGDTLWRPTEGARYVDEPAVRQGFIERSNVDPVLEIARLTEVQRAFEAGQNLLDTEHRRLERMIRILGDNS